MLVAAVIDKNEIILPIIEGSSIRIFDTEANQFKDYPNPAADLKEGRRGAALRFAEEKGATVFASPPQTFCELSYQKAQDDQVLFFQLERELSFKQFQELVKTQSVRTQKELPAEVVVPSK